MIATEMMCAGTPTTAVPARNPFQNLFERRRQVLCADVSIPNREYGENLMTFNPSFKSLADFTSASNSTHSIDADPSSNSRALTEIPFSPQASQSCASSDWSNFSPDYLGAGEWILEKTISINPIGVREERDASTLATEYFDAVMGDQVITPPAMELRKLIEDNFGREQKFLRQALNVVRPESVHSWLRKALREGRDMSNEGLLKAFGAPDTMLLERALIMHILAKRWHGVGCPLANPYR